MPRPCDAPRLPHEAAFREEYGWCVDALREMWLDESIRPKLTDAVEGRISWE